MEQLKNWSDIFLTSLQNLWFDIVSAIPMLLAAVLLLLIGWIVARIVQMLSIRIFKLVKFEKWFKGEKAIDFLEKLNFKRNPSELVGSFMYWLVLLVFLVVISETLGWTVVSEKVAAIISYIPQLLAGLLIFIVGFYISNLVKRAISAMTNSLGIASGRILAIASFYILMVIITVTALDQIGIDVGLIKSNLIVIVAGVMAAFAIAYGIGARQTVSNLLSSFYSKRILTEGQKISFDGIEGIVTKIGSVSVTIETQNGSVIVPAERFSRSILTIMTKKSTDTRNS